MIVPLMAINKRPAIPEAQCILTTPVRSSAVRAEADIRVEGTRVSVHSPRCAIYFGKALSSAIYEAHEVHGRRILSTQVGSEAL